MLGSVSGERLIPTPSERPIGVGTDVRVAADPDDLRVALESETGFRRWYERHVPAVYGYLATRCLGDADLVQDLTQETFVAAIEARRRFDGRSEVTTWLCGIARHKLADHF